MAISSTRGAILLSAWISAAALLVAGCQMSAHNADVRADPAATASGPSAAAPAKAEKGGAELWAQTCNHCHNLRSPSTYGPAQWEVAVYDMRVRANLTGEEQRKVLEFLKAASQ